MEREQLYYVLAEQQVDFSKKEQLISRELTPKVLDLLKLKMPIVITGVRRCGKSSLLKIIKNQLGLAQKEYLYINFNDERLVDFTIQDFQTILDFLVEEEYTPNAVLFIDEIQEVQGWEKWIDRIRHTHKIIITGSNSKLLSKEISTVLTGRSLSVSLFPFSFKEYLAYKQIPSTGWKRDRAHQAKIRKAFKDYLTSGGLPQRVISGRDLITAELYQNILYRDIIGRFNRNLTKPIKEISVYLLSNATSTVSLRTLSAISEITNLTTIKEIIDVFESAFLFFSTSKFDYSLRKQAHNPKKIYSIDPGFITSVGFQFSQDSGKLLENVVGIELRRRGHELYYAKGKGECDFLLKQGRAIIEAIQVTQQLNEYNTKREIAGVREAMENYQVKRGLLLVENAEREYKLQGIVVKPIWQWLLEESVK